MATASGIDAQLGIVDEVTYGTRVAPTRFYEFVSEGMKLERERIESQAIRAGRRTLHRWNAGVQRVAGDVELEFAPQGFGLLLKHVFGGVATTGVGPFTHTFTPGALDGKSFTMQVGRPDIGGTVRPFDYLGCKVSSWELSASVNEYAKLRASIYAAHEDTSQSLATASYAADLQPFVFTHGSLTIAGAAYDVREITISGENGLAIDRHFLQATNPERPKEPKESGLREFTGSLTSDFIDLTAYNRYVNGTEAALVLTFNAGASAQSVWTLNVRYDGETPNVSGHELLELPLQFKAVHGTADASAITATLINGDATP